MAPKEPVQNAPSEKKQGTTRAFFKFILNALIVIAISWFGSTWSLKNMDALDSWAPFLGLHAPSAAEIAQDYIDDFYPEFSNAEKEVTAVKIDGIDLYYVDFFVIDSESSKALRIAVSRDLQSLFVAEYAEVSK